MLWAVSETIKSQFYTAWVYKLHANSSIYLWNTYERYTYKFMLMQNRKMNFQFIINDFYDAS